MSGTTIDARIPLAARAPEINPFAQLGQTAGVANALTQFQANQAQLQGRNAVGEAIQGAIDPATGKYDPARFYQLLQGNPMARYMAPEAMLQGKQLELGQTQLQTMQAQLGMVRLNHIRQALTGLLANPSATPQMVIEEITRLVSLPEGERPFSPQAAAAVLASMPQNPAQLREWLIQQAARADAGVAQLTPFLPQGVPVQTGGATEFMDRDPITGQIRPNTQVPNTPPTGERNQLVQRYNPVTRQMELVPRDQVAPMSTGTGAPAPGTAAPVSPLGTGRYPTSQAAPGPAAAVPAAPPLGAEQAAAAVGVGSGEQVTNLQRAAAEVPTMRAALDNMAGLLDQFESGPGADWQRMAQAWTNRNIPDLLGGRFEWNANRIASQEEFNKLAYQIAQSQFRALGGTGSNDQLASAMSTSPNELISRLGNKGIIAMLRGNTDAIGVQQREWQRWSQQNAAGPERYGEFLAQWNREFNPQVFQAIYLKPEQRAALVGSMTPTQFDQYAADFRRAIERGWIRAPTAELGRAARPNQRPRYEDPRNFGYTDN